MSAALARSPRDTSEGAPTVPGDCVAYLSD